MKNFVCSAVFFFLYRDLRVLQKKDSRVRAGLAAMDVTDVLAVLNAAW